MPRYAAFLRGINVSGQKIIKMEVLKEMFALPGIRNVVTYIQSGNVAFDAAETDAGKLKAKIEKKLEKDLGYKVVTILRSVEELREVVAMCPFGADDESRKLYVHFLADACDSEQVRRFDGYKSAGEEIAVMNKEVYLLTPAYGNTKLTNVFIEKKLSTQSTARNWNTVNKMIGL